MASTEVDVSKTHPYTCNSCAVAFRNSDAQRAHMRTDWHRYNLKRKIADLPPVSSDDYNEKVLAAQATTKAAQDQAAFVRSCEACQKIYYSENAYQNHILSQKHKLRVAAVGAASAAPSEAEATRDPEAKAEFEQIVAGMKEASIKETGSLPGRAAPPPDATPGPEHPLSPEKSIVVSVPLSRCLFCNYDSPNVKLSVEHMTKMHGLFIPEKNYLADLEGMLGYMQAKIRENHECLSCHKLKSTADGIQTHMRDKGHCKIAFESEEEMIEVGQFYDFSSTYSDDEDEESDEEMEDIKANGGVKIDGKDDDGWETDSSFSSLDSEELTSVPNDDRSESYSRLQKSRHHASNASRAHRNADGFHSHAHAHNNAVFYDDHEMHLPSGRVAGHRSMKKYFRQNLHSYPTAAERNERAQRLLEDGSGEDEDMDDGDADRPSRSQALLKRGEAGMLGTTDTQKRDVKLAEQRGRTTAQRQQSRYLAKLEKQNNFQKHFRDPLLQ